MWTWKHGLDPQVCGSYSSVRSPNLEAMEYKSLNSQHSPCLTINTLNFPPFSSMETASILAPPSLLRSSSNHAKPNKLFLKSISIKNFNKNKHLTSRRISAISDVPMAAVSDPAEVGITWEIVVGALAGITPFVVAGIEFSKRIVKQRKCQVCGGSGLVLRDKKYYFRCPSCGGFLPWQSWRRFFTG